MNADDTRVAHTRAVDSLQQAYAILIGLALTNAVGLLLQANRVLPAAPTTQGGQQGGASTNLIFAAFLSTLVVFYHGMNRHLDDTFVIGGVHRRSNVLLLTDIFVFLSEGAVLVAMGSTIDNASVFLVAWTVLLGVDVAWGLFVYVVAGKPPFKWILNNCIFLFLAWASWRWILPQSTIGIAVAEIARSVVDYKINWDFYFPARPASESMVNGPTPKSS